MYPFQAAGKILALLCAIISLIPSPAYSSDATKVMNLAWQVADLKKQLAQSEQALAEARQKNDQTGQAASDKIQPGPITIGCAIKANYVYADHSSTNGLSRGDNGHENLLGTGELILLGAYDFAWPVATKVWVPATPLSYVLATPDILWLGSVTPYPEYGSIIKDNLDFNGSELFIPGAAWVSAGWYIYSGQAWSNGNLFIGNKGDNNANIFNGFGVMAMINGIIV